MAQLFNPENPFMQFLTRITDLLILSILWAVCSIPLVTIGPATAALYYVTLKMIQNSESGICKSFFSSFRKNLRQGIVLTLLLALLGLLILWNRSILSQHLEAYGDIVWIVFAVLGAVYLVGVCLVFPLLAWFKNTVMGTLRNAYLLALAHLPQAILICAMNLVPVLVFLFAPSFFYKSLPVWFIAAPGIIAYFCSLLLKKIFQRLAIPGYEEEPQDEAV